MNDDNLFLGHILDEIIFIEENFSKISFDSFMENAVLKGVYKKSRNNW